MARRADSYMLALLRESLRLYAAAIPGATPVQCMAWLHDRRLFIENAWPFDVPNRRTVAIIDRAMHHVVHSKMHLQDALADARIELR